MESGERQHRLAVQLGIIETIQQMNTAWSRGSQADSKAVCVFSVGAGHERGRFFMAHLNKADFIAPGAEGLHDAVNAVTGQAKNYLDAPIVQGIDQNF